MTQAFRGILAMVGACTIWGLSPLYYKLLAHVPPPEVLSHRTLWSVILFAGVLAVQGRLSEIGTAFRGRRQVGVIALAAAMISVNWFVFILSVQIGRTTEASLGYYIFPLMTVFVGWLWFGERLGIAQWGAVALALAAVLVLTVGLGVTPWISLILATSFAVYGALKKGLALGPVVSVTCEILIYLPFWLVLLAWYHGNGQGHFGTGWQTSLLLVLSGPLTAVPLILFSYAARRVRLSTVGVLQYINPTLQFFCAVLAFGEPFTLWHQIAFALIWSAVAIFSFAALSQDRAARRASIAALGVSAQIRNSPSEGSAKP
ncbi:EamA family transporter RarD [Ruegeria sediminis]|uniref:EamA family transporter RarD n=1 Tax=Ruegeria sediminis TaxID=2583820 RepID=A0ABY2WVN5_9RHOB|nr:EamA family transporter RarD [Ruegeria sediminis]TMV06352.1 EamA family transporter RarD [Ruegeria sediminis]